MNVHKGIQTYTQTHTHSHKLTLSKQMLLEVLTGMAYFFPGWYPVAVFSSNS